MSTNWINYLSTSVKRTTLVITSVFMAISGVALMVPSHVKADIIHYDRGVYELSAPLEIPDGFTLSGEGQGQTVLKAAPGYTGVLVKTVGSMDSLTAGVHHPNVAIRDITIDGNATAERGIYFSSVDNLVVENVEVKNTKGSAIEHRGTKGTAFTEYQTWSNVSAHDCGGWGLINGLRTRKISYVNIQVHDCANGMQIDHSEAQADGIQVTNNKGEGVWLRNVYGMNINNIRATGNGKFGIHAQGFVYSVGSNWQALNNGVRNVWFDANAPLPSFNYGVTRNSFIHGLQAGHIPYQVGAYDASKGTPLVIDDGVDVAITDKLLLND